MIVDAAKALGRLGTLALVGTGEALATLDIKDLIRGGKSVRGVMEGDADPVRVRPAADRARRSRAGCRSSG